MVQNMGSQLAGNVASLIQQYTVLSMENKALKQHLLRMKQEKFIVDGKNIILSIFFRFYCFKRDVTQSILRPIMFFLWGKQTGIVKRISVTIFESSLHLEFHHLYIRNFEIPLWNSNPTLLFSWGFCLCKYNSQFLNIIPLILEMHNMLLDSI